MDEYEVQMQQWHTKADSEEDAFVQFIIEYLAFIGYLSNYIYNGNMHDRERIIVIHSTNYT